MCQLKGKQYNPMSIIYLKFTIAFMLFVVACTAGMLATRLTKIEPDFFAHANSFARGIFLGAGFIHLLPDAVSSLSRPTNYPILYALCAFTIIILLFIEQGAARYLKHQNKHTTWLPYLLMILLSFHSLIAGAALGLENNYAHLLILFVAIIAHKGAAAFALGLNMNAHHVSLKNRQRLMLLFACMTPFGLLIGQELIQHTTHHTILIPFFDAITAGTFIYIATLDRINPKVENMTTLTNLFSLLVGFLLMAIIAVFL